MGGSRRASRGATIARTVQWSVRRDLSRQKGVAHIRTHNNAPLAVRGFMADRARVERLKTPFEDIIGPALGPNPTGVSGLDLLGAT